MTGASEMRFGPFLLQGRHGPLFKDGQEIALQAKTMALLWTLARHRGEVVTKQVLMDTIWAGTVVGDDALTFQVHALRRALGDDLKKPRYVITAHRIGFRFGVPVEQGPASPPGRDSLVGRAPELAMLSGAYARARAGQRQIVLVSGEAGVGKTRLVDEWLQGLRGDSDPPRVAHGQCGERSESGEPFFPLLEAFTRLGRDAADDAFLDSLRKVAPSWLLELPGLLSSQEIALLKRQTAGQGLERKLREFSEAIESLAQHRLLVMVLEDLHWCDSATLDALSLLARRREPARLLVILTSRTIEPILHNHPIRALQQSLLSRGLAQQLMPGYLDLAAVAAYLRSRFGGGVDDRLVQRIHERSAGHPLFLAQIADYLAAHGLDEGRLSELPPGIRDLIELQLRELPLEEQQILEVASLGGGEFSAATVAAALRTTAEQVEEACDRLAQTARFVESQGLAIWPNGVTSGRYRFRHILHENVLAQRMAPARVARLQRLMADNLEGAYGSRAGDMAAELALRFEAAGAHDRALPYVTKLAAVALERVALTETLYQTERGLRLAQSLADSQARQLAELRLHVIAVSALRMRYGAAHTLIQPSLRQMEQRLDVGQQDPALLQAALSLLWWSHNFGARFEDALRYADMARQLGRSLENPVLQCSANSWLSSSLCMKGRYPEAQEAAEQALRIADGVVAGNPGMGALEPGCTARVALALTHWYVGRQEQAFSTSRRALEEAAIIGNPYSECANRLGGRQALLMNAREYHTMIAEYPEMLAFCRKYEQADAEDWCTRYFLIARSIALNTGEHLGELRQRVRAQIEGGKLLGATICSLGESEICLRLGLLDEAQRSMHATFDLLYAHGSRSIEPEVWRIDAALKLRMGDGDAEQTLRKAIDVARQQGALSFELRAAMDLARWLAGQSRRAEAAGILGDTYGRFTEGFAMREISEARLILDTLTG